MDPFLDADAAFPVGGIPGIGVGDGSRECYSIGVTRRFDRLPVVLGCSRRIAVACLILGDEEFYLGNSDKIGRSVVARERHTHRVGRHTTDVGQCVACHSTEVLTLCIAVHKRAKTRIVAIFKSIDNGEVVGDIFLCIAVASVAVHAVVGAGVIAVVAPATFPGNIGCREIVLSDECRDLALHILYIAYAHEHAEFQCVCSLDPSVGHAVGK